MTPRSPLQQFLASWFVDSEGPGGDEAAARQFTHSATHAEVKAVLDEAANLMSGDEDMLLVTIDREANRYFETPVQAKAWLHSMCETIRQESGS